MKHSDRNVFHETLELNLTLAGMSYEYEKMQNHYEAISNNGIVLAIESDQIRVFKDTKHNSKLLTSIEYIKGNITHTEEMGVRPEDIKFQIAGISIESLR